MYSETAKKYVERYIKLIDEERWFDFFCNTYYPGDDDPDPLTDDEVNEVISILRDAGIYITDGMIKQYLLDIIKDNLILFFNQNGENAKILMHTFINRYFENHLGYSDIETISLILQHLLELGVEVDGDGYMIKSKGIPMTVRFV